MALFLYTAKNSAGQTRNGTVDARTSELALGLLKQQGLFVVTLSEKTDSIADLLLNFQGVSKKDIVIFTRQFSTMISAGLPIARALEVLASQTSNKFFKKTIYEVLRAIEGGSSLSVAMGKFPDVFSPTYQALIKAGESSGRMDEILQRLAETMEADNELNAKFKAAMVYPAIVLIAMFGVMSMLMIFVIPKLAEMYENMNVELPIVTQLMIDASKFMVKFWYLMIITIVGAFLGLRWFLKTSEGRFISNEISMKLPVFGRINRQKEQAQFARTLSLLISAAVPIVESLNIVSNVVTSLGYKQAALEAAKQVEKGNSLSSYFRSNPIFPPIISQMTAVGEETGKMDEVLKRVAGYYDTEVDNLIKGLTSALEPIILLILGVMVGFMIISIITPIYKLTSAL